MPPDWLQQWAKVFGPVLTFGGLFLTWIGILSAVRRGRRELTANLLYNWSRDVDWPASRAIELARDLPEDVVKSIEQRKPTNIDISHYDSVVTVLREKFSDQGLPTKIESESLFQITEEHSRFIRFLWARWLNRLEGTLAAWDQRAANASTLKASFKPLVISSQIQIMRLSTEDDLPITRKFLKEIDQP